MKVDTIKKLFDMDISPDRKTAVMQDIFDGSVPAPRFYVMVIISNLIAVLGLIANSPAVIIGAMLVAPLMTPIFGISLALVRGNSHLLLRAIVAEAQGVGLAILLSFLFGLLPLAIEPTAEMLSRTQPNLLDLMVAVFAGLAGAYAMVDERISPSLPGVAIATAIVPPLANTGLCLALGEYMGGLGSFALFLANFLSILLAASLVFAAAGMAPFFQKVTPKDLTRRFGVAILSFSVIAVVFTFSLIQMVQRRHEKNTIERTLIEQFSEIPGTFLRDFILQSEKDQLHVLAAVHTPSMISPEEVQIIESRLIDELGKKVDLIVRNSIVKDIGATGSRTPVSSQTLDGDFIEDAMTPVEEKIALAEQVFWEQCGKKAGFEVINMTHRTGTAGDFILATIQIMAPLTVAEIESLETEIRNRLQDQTVQILVSSHVPRLQTSRGTILFEWSRYEDMTPDRHEKLDRIKDELVKAVGLLDDVFLISTHFRIDDPQWQVMLEVTGVRLVKQAEVAHLRRIASKAAGR
ncbi:MAG: TIGR00341 family protein, partial [Planctomycetota bacterium]